jgi:hypothetical protein
LSIIKMQKCNLLKQYKMVKIWDMINCKFFLTLDENLWSKVKGSKKEMYIAKLHCQHANPKNYQHATNKFFHYNHELTMMDIEHCSFQLSNYIFPFFPFLSLFPSPITCTLSIRYGNGVCNNSEKEGYETWNFGEETCVTILKWW